MSLGDSLKSYTYWGVKDSSVHFSIAIHREKNRRKSSATFCFFFFTSGCSSLCYGYSSVSFSAFPLVNFFSQNIGYAVTIQLQYFPATLILLQDSSSSGVFGERETVSCQLPSYFPSAPISLSHLRPLLSWLANTPTHSHPKMSLDQKDM